VAIPKTISPSAVNSDISLKYGLQTDFNKPLCGLPRTMT